MSTLINTTLKNEKLEELVHSMCLSGTRDCMSNYHNADFDNFEDIEKDGYYMSFRLYVNTKLNYFDEVEITYLEAKDVEIWFDEEEVEVTECMYDVIEKEIRSLIDRF